MEMKTTSRSMRYSDLALTFRYPQSDSPDDLRLAYTRLFLGPGRPVAHPYESVYIDGHLVGESTQQVVTCYTEAGLQVCYTDPELPDHISLELAFMAHLVMQEETDSEDALTWRERQHRFLDQHLSRWLPSFCERIERSDAHPFYCQAARAACNLVEEDLARLSSKLNEATRFLAEDDILPLQPEKSGLPSGDQPRRHPNIRIHVDPSMCTVCTLCVDNCRQGALAIHLTPTTLGLKFDPAHCNGCRVCLRLCPEDAITLHRDQSLLAPLSTNENILIATRRVTCPECKRPHIASTWLERLAERLGDDISTRRSLELCPLCKAASGIDLASLSIHTREASTGG